jgi:hypothetical protein
LPAVEPGQVADALPDRLAEQLGDALGRRARGDAAGLSRITWPVHQSSAMQRGGDRSRLAGAGRRDEHGGARFAQRREAAPAERLG